MRARVLGLSLVAVATAVVAASVDACRAPTQVILEIETTAVCTDLKGVRVFVGADAELVRVLSRRGRWWLLDASPVHERDWEGP